MSREAAIHLSPTPVASGRRCSGRLGSVLLGMGSAGLLAGAGWYVLAWMLPPTVPENAAGRAHTFLLPPYAGPLAVGQPFPPFVTTLVDGSPLTQESLRDGRATVMVFFRGKW